jgi:hypothetical protein
MKFQPKDPPVNAGGSLFATVNQCHDLDLPLPRHVTGALHIAGQSPVQISWHDPPRSDNADGRRADEKPRSRGRERGSFQKSAPKCEAQ